MPDLITIIELPDQMAAEMAQGKPSGERRYVHAHVQPDGTYRLCNIHPAGNAGHDVPENGVIIPLYTFSEALSLLARKAFEDPRVALNPGLYEKAAEFAEHEMAEASRKQPN